MPCLCNGAAAGKQHRHSSTCVPACSRSARVAAWQGALEAAGLLRSCLAIRQRQSWQLLSWRQSGTLRRQLQLRQQLRPLPSPCMSGCWIAAPRRRWLLWLFRWGAVLPGCRLFWVCSAAASLPCTLQGVDQNAGPLYALSWQLQTLKPRLPDVNRHCSAGGSPPGDVPASLGRGSWSDR